VFSGGSRSEFASLAELLDHYVFGSGELKEKSGRRIDLWFPLLNETQPLDDKFVEMFKYYLKK